MLEHHSTQGGTGHTNEQVHANQRALVHFATLHPGSSGVHHIPPRHVANRRYGLHAREMAEIRKRVRDATCEALSYEGQSAEWVAERVALATERAIFAVGVEPVETHQ